MTDIKYTDLPLKTTPLTENDEAIILDASNGGIVSRVKGELIRWPKGDRGEQWPQWPQGIQGIQWEPWKNGERWPTWPQGERWPIWPKGEQGMQWPQGNDGNPGRDGAQGQKGEPWVGVKTITSKKSGKTTTVTIEKTDGTSHNFQLQDGADGTGAGDMIKANNLSDLTNKAEARKNLDVYTKSEVDTKIQNATPNIDLSGYARKQHEHTIADVTNLQSSLDTKLNKSEKDAPNGVAILDGNGVLPSRYLPPSDVLVFWEKANFPAQGETKKIYFEQSTRKIYVYNGSAGYKEYTEHIGRTKSLANGTDLNDILEDGWFVSETNVKSSTLRNAPISRAFTLISYKAAGFIQEVIDYDLQSRWIRRYYGFLNNWSAWQEVPIAKQDISGKANLAGGNTFSGDQILNNALQFGDYAPAANQSTKARVGRATDRGEGSVTFQFGKGDISKQNFQIVDGNWTKVLFEVADNGKVLVPDWLLVGGQVFANRKTPWEAPTISLAIGDGKTGFHHFDTGKFGLYANGQILQDFYQGHEPVCANGLGQYPTIMKMTKAQYDAIAVKGNNCIYFITE